jgi:hypothetical protein
MWSRKHTRTERGEEWSKHRQSRNEGVGEERVGMPQALPARRGERERVGVREEEWEWSDEREAEQKGRRKKNHDLQQTHTKKKEARPKTRHCAQLHTTKKTTSSTIEPFKAQRWCCQ